MYSTKNIEKILIANMINQSNKKPIEAEALNEETQSQFRFIESADELKEIMTSQQYSQALEAYKQNHRIYRGVHGTENGVFAAVVTPGIRISENSSNVYTKLTSEIFTNWENFPKRNRSTICTTSYKTALKYSNSRPPYVIFPQNNTKIGICSQKDFWYSFPFLATKTHIGVMNDFNNSMLNLMEGVMTIPKRKIADTFKYGTAYDIKELFNQFEADVEDMDDYFDDNITFIKHFKILDVWYNIYRSQYNMTFLEYLEYLMSPKQNQFRIISIDKIPKTANKEVWFEGENLMLRADLFRRKNIKQIIGE